MHTTNPFLDDSSDDGSAAHNTTNGNGARRRYSSSSATPRSSPSYYSSSPSLFPPWMSSWMNTSTRSAPHTLKSPSSEYYEDDDGSFYDCLSKIDMMEDETEHTDNRGSTLLDQGVDVTVGGTHSPSSSIDDDAEQNTNQASSLVSTDTSIRGRRPYHDHHSYNSIQSTPITNNSIRRRDSTDNSTHSNDHRTNLDQSNLSNSIVSPLKEALSTWLSPYAVSARKAGRRLLLSPEETNGEEEVNVVVVEDSNDSATDETQAAVRFRLDKEGTGSNKRRSRSKILHRTASSPALLTVYSDEKGEDGSMSRTEAGASHINGALIRRNNHDTIVLKEIDMQGENNEEDGTVMHPWTKLIHLEELGTASSWFVLLLPYAFMILAVILDGDAQLKNEVVGPLRANGTCADLVGGSVAEPYGVSVKGYFPVPFTFTGKRHNSQMNRTASNETCTYPFELREGVGLLSHGVDDVNSSSPTFLSDRSSIVDARYRYLMSHGHAFTSGVITHVPATSQSLRGSAKFNNLSSRAVALVSRGSVLVSTIVFQRRTQLRPESAQRLTVSGDATETIVQHHQTTQHATNTWSPVLILSPKRLDMICKWNSGSKTGNDDNTDTWNCTSSQLIDAFFSLPNTAVLTGGELRVDTLLSHQAQHKSFSDDHWFNENTGTMEDDYFYHDLEGNVYQSNADKLLSKADVSNPQEILAELSTKSVYKLSHESEAYDFVVEITRIVALSFTLAFLCYWCWSMGHRNDIPGLDTNNETDTKGRVGVWVFARQLMDSVSRSWKQSDDIYSRFWWESPWITFPERRYLLLLLVCLLLLQNPLLAYAFFHPSLYSSAKFRCAADSLSGISIHGILFLWLCLVHGLRYQ